jgi:hypothetical protein
MTVLGISGSVGVMFGGSTWMWPIKPHYQPEPGNEHSRNFLPMPKTKLDKKHYQYY